MAKSLTDAQIKAIDKPGRVALGAGLYLRTRATGSKSFVAIATVGEKRVEVALGTYPTMRLRQAQERAEEERARIKAGLPKPGPMAEPVGAVVALFGEYAMDIVDDIESGYKNLKHRKQWRSTLKTYCGSIWDKPVDAIEVGDVLEILKPIWTTKSETAGRVRQRIERVIEAAISDGLRVSSNPATIARLKHRLPKREKLQRGHHAALPYAEMPAFWEKLDKLTSVSSEALRFGILTAARSGEVRGAEWAEINMDSKLWVIPAERMKAEKEHRVPLCSEALAVLKRMALFGSVGLVFPSRKRGASLSDMALLQCLKGICTGVTVHGFRSTFRDWVGEETDHPREVAEAALAHAVGNAVELSYRRGDALEKRRLLMDDWNNFVINTSLTPVADHHNQTETTANTGEQ